MASPVEWAKAFARQARADFATWQALQSVSVVPPCHELLFLQMACEKLTKAHLFHKGSDSPKILTSHAHTAKHLPTIIGRCLADFGQSPKAIRKIQKHVKHIAQEIELLSPSVDRNDQRRDNCEYPWEAHDGSVYSPLDWTFQPVHLLTQPAGRTFLKIVKHAIDQLA
jgi:hypothetical protein